MAVAFNLRKMIHRKSAEFLAPLPPGNSAAGWAIVGDKNDRIPGHDSTFLITGPSAVWRYNADEDAWIQAPNSGAAGAFAAGACAELRTLSAPGGVQTLTATGGTTTTISTSLNLAYSLAGCTVRIVTGPGAGYAGTVARNTTGANATIALTTPVGTAVTSSSTFQLYAGSVWFFNSGTSAVGFAVYDLATNAWTQRSVTGLPTAWGTDAQLVGTLNTLSDLPLVTGTATAGAGSTLTDGTKAWPTNGWTNAQVRITGGTGIGQVRTVASNTGTVLTVSSAWTTNPDATSTYRIEGNEDHLYLAGNNAVTLYRYTISTNTWATITPGAARAGAFGAGGTMDWIEECPDADWSEGGAGVYAAHYSTTLVRQRGRYLYCFRGGGSNALDVYDIAANTWISGVVYGNQMETFTTGSCSIDCAGLIYLMKENTGRLYKFDVARHRIDPLFFVPIPQGTAVAGDKLVVQTFREGASTGRYLYLFNHTRSEFIRLFLV